jgi:ketosteroid isomerase-like protein
MKGGGTLESLTLDFFGALDRKDFDRLLALAADDVQIVDEISRGWLRGRQAIDDYLRQLGAEVSNIVSSPVEIHTAEIDSAGIVTCVLEQRYELRGDAVQITAPTTLVARRQPDGWRWVLFHSVPIAPEA